MGKLIVNHTGELASVASISQRRNLIMKNWFTKLLAGLLTVMMLMSSSVAFMEEMPEAQDAIVEETASVTNEAIPQDSTMEPEDELIAVDAFEAAVSDTDEVDLDEADSASLGDDLDVTDDDHIDNPSETPLTLEAGYEERFTDPEFRAWVLNKYDGNNSGSLEDTEWAAIKAETVVDLSEAPNKDKIRDLEGIRNFERLQTLNVSGCSNLTRLWYWAGYYLTNLNIRGCTSLTVLNCSENQVSDLFLDDCIKLESLYCNGNQLKSLDVSKLTALKNLNCEANSISELNVSNNPELSVLSCGFNWLSELKIDNNIKLHNLQVYENPLSTLDISNCPELNKCVYYGKSWTEPGTEEAIQWYSFEYPDDYPSILGLDKSTTLTSVKPADPEPDPDPAPAPAPAPAVVAPAPAPAPAPAEPITINKTPASTKAKAKKGKVTVTWKKIKKTKKTKALLGQIKSIQVQYSTDPNFATDVNTKTVSKKKTKATLSLQRKTTYYIRVRYVGSDGVSNWGAVKAVKTK